MTIARLPFLPRVANLFYGALNSIGIGRIRLSLDDIERTVSKKLGWSDFGNTSYRESAQVFLDAFEAGANAHFVGRYLVRENLSMLLYKRLQRQRFLHENNHAREFVLQKKSCGNRPPIFVLGSPRSGTTLLFNLLALDPQAKAPRFWEVLDPAPPASVLTEQEVEDRVCSAEKRLNKYKRVLPKAFQSIHVVDSVRHHEEDYFLLEPTFRSPSLSFVCGNGKSYREYLYGLPDEDVIDAYEDFAQFIRVLMYGQDQLGKSHWVSKSPVHSPFAWALPRVFENAIIIHTHRDPVERIPSLCSLISVAEQLVRPPSRKEEIVDRVLNFNHHSTEGMKRGRIEANSTSAKVIDVDYVELKQSPLESVARIYQQVGLELSTDYQSAMREWLNHKNIWDPKKRGVHRYCPEDFGLTRQMLANLEP